MDVMESSQLSGEEHVEQQSEDVPFVITGRHALTPSIVEIDLAPLQQVILHRAGQYILLSDVQFRVPPRSYSVANAPRPDGSMRLFVTRVADGETSRWIHEVLSVGTSVLVSGPYGSFVDDPAWTGPVLHLAGGSGLAPILAIVEDALSRRTSRDTDVLFSARHPNDVYLQDVFDHWEQIHPEFQFRRTLTRSAGDEPLGRVPEVLRRLYPDLSGHLVFVAGSPGLVDACSAAAQARGALRSRVRTEAFFVEPQPWHSAA